MVSAYIQADLIVKLHLLVNPVVLGKRMGIFQDINHRHKPRLANSIPFECGIVVLNYVPAA